MGAGGSDLHLHQRAGAVLDRVGQPREEHFTPRPVVARPAVAHDADPLAWRDGQSEAVENGGTVTVAETDPAKLHGTAAHLQGGRFGRVDDLAFGTVGTLLYALTIPLRIALVSLGVRHPEDR